MWPKEDFSWFINYTLRYRRIAEHNHASSSLNKIEIHLTYKCNCSCSNCLTLTSQAPSSDIISLGDIRRFIAESIELDWKWQKIALHGGEPTLHPQCMEIIELFAEYRNKYNQNLSMTLCTNGISSATKTLIRIARIKRYNIEIGPKNLKTMQSNSPYVPVNIAPVDVGHKSTLGCYMTNECGIALNSSGYFECSSAAAASRVFKWGPITRSLKEMNIFRVVDAYHRHCKYCGFSAPDLERTTIQEISKTWRTVLDRYNKGRTSTL